MKIRYILLFCIVLGTACGTKNNNQVSQSSAFPSAMFQYSDFMEPRWVSFENISGEKGMGGKENNGAKGHPCDSLAAGATKVLLDIKGPGIINRMWITISDRSPEMLRSLVLKMYWDRESKPAVNVPFGDFFSVGLGKTAA